MSWETALDRQIHDYLPDLKWAADEPMAKHTSFRIGGPAKRMAFPKTREQLVVLMGFLQDAGVKPLLIGNGTNLLVADKGLDTVVIDTSAELSHIELTDEGEIAADAGVSLAKLALFAWKNGLTGLEFAHGIPGSSSGWLALRRAIRSSIFALMASGSPDSSLTFAPRTMPSPAENTLWR